LPRRDLDVPVAQVLEVLGQLVDLLALLADNHADPRRVDVDDDLLARAVDLDLGDPRSAIAALDILADLLVLDQKLGEVLFVRVPVAQPVGHDAGTGASWSNFLPHGSSFVLIAGVRVAIATWTPAIHLTPLRRPG